MIGGKVGGVVLASGVLMALVAPACRKPQESAESQRAAASVVAPANGRVAIEVLDTGYRPAEVRARKGQALTLVFRRTSDQGCGDKIVFPALHIEKDLPLNTDVPISITPTEKGQIVFSCAMNMLRGTVVVE